MTIILRDCVRANENISIDPSHAINIQFLVVKQLQESLKYRKTNSASRRNLNLYFTISVPS